MMRAAFRLWALACSWLLLAVVCIGGAAVAGDRSSHAVADTHGDAASSSRHPAWPTQFPDGQAWTIEGGLAWGVGLSDAVVFVPQGFVHDRAGVPPVLWSLASYTRAAVVHDWLYWAQPCSRLQSDNLLVIAMKENRVPWIQRRLIYRAVRLQGHAIWRRNAEERRLGMPRFNPYGYVPDDMNWPELRARMFREGVRDVRHVVPDDFCRHGDRQEVPGPPDDHDGGAVPPTAGERSSGP